jgi:hypothetical protein
MAPDLITLHQFVEAILSGSKMVLQSNGITGVEIQQDIDDLSTPRVELQVVMGSPLGHVYPTGSKVLFDAYNGSLNATVVTDRINNKVSHSVFAGKVQSILSDLSYFNTGSILPYHLLSRMDLRGSAVSLETEQNNDLTNIGFEFQIWIRPDAWTK